MSANQRRILYSVWKNGTDEIIAIDETAEKCAELMGITRQAFYTYNKRPVQQWHIERTGKEECKN